MSKLSLFIGAVVVTAAASSHANIPSQAVLISPHAAMPALHPDYRSPHPLLFRGQPARIQVVHTLAGSKPMDRIPGFEKRVSDANVNRYIKGWGFTPPVNRDRARALAREIARSHP